MNLKERKMIYRIYAAINAVPGAYIGGGMAAELARAEIARRHGQEAAKKATFRVVWGGHL